MCVCLSVNGGVLVNMVNPRLFGGALILPNVGVNTASEPMVYFGLKMKK